MYKPLRKESIECDLGIFYFRIKNLPCQFNLVESTDLLK